MLSLTHAENYMKENTFYQTFCYAKVLEVYSDIKLFPLFHQNVKQFIMKQQKQENWAEIAFTNLKLLEIMKTSEQVVLGKPEIRAFIEIDIIKAAIENLVMAEMYEKAIEM